MTDGEQRRNDGADEQVGEQVAAPIGQTPGDPDKLNDRSGYQGCFGCGAQNLIGLQLAFRREGNEIVTEFTPDLKYQGFPGVVHGGVVATLLDEALSRTATLVGRWMMTARLEIRYRRAALVGEPLRVTARAITARSRIVTASGEVCLASDPTVVVAEAEGTFLPITQQYQDEMVAQHPEFADFFAR